MGSAHSAATKAAALKVNDFAWDALSSERLVCALRKVLVEATATSRADIDGPAIIFAFLEANNYDATPFLKLKCRPQVHSTQSQQCEKLLSSWPREKLLEFIDFLGLRGSLSNPLSVRLRHVMQQMVDHLLRRVDNVQNQGIYLGRRVVGVGANAREQVRNFFYSGDARAQRAHTDLAAVLAEAPQENVVAVIHEMRDAMGLPRGAPPADVREARRTLGDLLWLLVPFRNDIRAWWQALPTSAQLVVRVQLWLNGVIPRDLVDKVEFVAALTKAFVTGVVVMVERIAFALKHGIVGAARMAIRNAASSWRWLRTLTWEDVRHGAAAAGEKMRGMLPGTNVWVRNATFVQLARAMRILGLGTTSALQNMQRSSEAIAAMWFERMRMGDLDIAQREVFEPHVRRAVQTGEVAPELMPLIQARPALVEQMRVQSAQLRAAVRQARLAVFDALNPVAQGVMRADVRAATWFGGLFYRLYIIAQYMGVTARDALHWFVSPDVIPSRPSFMHTAAALVRGVPIGTVRSRSADTAARVARNSAELRAAAGPMLLAACVGFLKLLRNTAFGVRAAIPILGKIWMDTINDCRYGRHRDGSVRTAPRPAPPRPLPTQEDVIREMERVAAARFEMAHRGESDAPGAAGAADAGAAGGAWWAWSNPFVFGIDGSVRPFVQEGFVGELITKTGGMYDAFVKWASSFSDIEFVDPFDSERMADGSPRPRPSPDAPSPPAPAPQPPAPRAKPKAKRKSKSKPKPKAKPKPKPTAFDLFLIEIREKLVNINKMAETIREHMLSHLPMLKNVLADDRTARRIESLMKLLNSNSSSSRWGTLAIKLSVSKKCLKSDNCILLLQFLLERRMKLVKLVEKYQLTFERQLMQKIGFSESKGEDAEDGEGKGEDGEGKGEDGEGKGEDGEGKGEDGEGKGEGEDGEGTTPQQMLNAFTIPSSTFSGLIDALTELKGVLQIKLSKRDAKWNLAFQTDVYKMWKSNGSDFNVEAVDEAQREVMGKSWDAPISDKMKWRIKIARGWWWRRFPNSVLLVSFVDALHTACRRRGTRHNPDPDLFKIGTGSINGDIALAAAKERELLETCPDLVCSTNPALTRQAAFTRFWNALEEAERHTELNEALKVCADGGAFCTPEGATQLKDEKVMKAVAELMDGMKDWLWTNTNQRERYEAQFEAIEREHDAAIAAWKADGADPDGMPHEAYNDLKDCELATCLAGIHEKRRAKSKYHKAALKWHPDKKMIDDRFGSEMFKIISGSGACINSEHAGGPIYCPSEEAAELGKRKVEEITARVSEFIAHQQATLDDIERGEAPTEGQAEVDDLD